MERHRSQINEQNSGYIRGELLYTIFQNDVENFSIAKLKIIETNESYEEKEIVGKGHFINLQEGVQYTFYGSFKHHAKYGLQYEINRYETYIPDTKDGLVTYLSSDLFYGVGKKTAERIVETLGDNAIAKIIADPSVVQKVPKLSKKVAKSLTETLQELQGFEHVVLFLARYGVGLKLAHKMYEYYKEETIDVLQRDPYQFVFEIEHFGFETADRIARLNGISLLHENRMKAGCLFVLQESIQEGHVFLPIDECIRRTLSLLKTPDIKENDLINYLQKLVEDKRVVMTDEAVYLPSLYYAEQNFAKHLQRIIDKPIDISLSVAQLMQVLGEIEEAEIISYGQEQFTAIKQALQSKIMILTGGPGTGKTTVIKAILKAYAEVYEIAYDIKKYESKADYPFVLAAPTGRAAKRLSESTGLPAVTIHRLLGWDGFDQFEKNEHNQLTGKFLIIDEFSMVDTWLANHLFQAIPDHMQVLLVGDDDQLPSVGPGQVLSDLLQSETLPIVRLNEVYRQQAGSKIIQLAHHIKNDTCTVDLLTKADDFSFIDCSANQLVEAIKVVFTRAIDRGIEPNDIQVLAPIYRSHVGINEINEQLQAIINPKHGTKRERKYGDITFRVGDRVIQQVNQPEDGVYNGDIGEIVAVFNREETEDTVEQLVVSFDGKEIVYTHGEFDHLMHAYCISIHKAQGSEFPIVILPVVSVYNRMLMKNLLYTAITRAKQSLIICGDKNAFIKGISTIDANVRYTSLIERLQEHLSLETSLEEQSLSPYYFN